MPARQRNDERIRILRHLVGRCFERVRFRGYDAVVIRTTEQRPISQRDYALFFDRAPFRVYPVGREYLYKWRIDDLLGSRDGLEIEPGGWDHEHCDACNRHINVNRTAWQTVRGSVFVLCPYCYRRVRQLGAS